MAFTSDSGGNTRNHGKFFPASRVAIFVTGKTDRIHPEIFNLKQELFALSPAKGAA